MFQPFEKFEPGYLKKLILVNKRFLVSQSYRQGRINNGGKKMAVLLSDYDNLGLAKIHYKAVRDDRLAAIIHLDDPVHFQKCVKITGDESQYDVYWATVTNAADVRKRIDDKYKANIRRFLLTNTTWKIGADETIRPSLQVIFGEIFMILKRGSETLRVKFEEIEQS